MTVPSVPGPPDQLRAGGGDLPLVDFNRISSLMQSEAGIDLPESKRQLVHSRLGARLRALRLTTYRDYCNFIESEAGHDELVEMVSVLTTNVTRFYREPHHFEYLTQQVIPGLSDRLLRGHPVRVWSAGCASGEEPYSLALTFLDAVPNLERLDFRILATDIDPAVLRAAASGNYPARALGQVPPRQKDRYFLRRDGLEDWWEIRPEVRALVAFRRLNLIKDWPLTRPFDVIVCRNVVIYFGPDTKSAVWGRLVRQLRPGGWLLTGHSERLTGDAAVLTRPVFTTTYRRLDADTARRSRPDVPER